MAVSTIQKMFTTEWKFGTQKSLPAGGRDTFTVDVSKTGYTPVGILGVLLSGNRTALGDLNTFSISGTTASVVIHNEDTQANTWGATVLVLYQKS